MAVVVVEFLGDVVGEFQMLALVVAHRHPGRMIGQDVGRHKGGVGVEPGRGSLAVVPGLVLELRHPVEPAQPGHAHEDPAEPRMGRHRGLQEHDMRHRIDAAGQHRGREFARLQQQLGRILERGDGVLVDHAI